jgi:hypothetical protein
MKKFTFVLCLFSIVAGLQAGEQTLQVTPQSLDDWAVTGADKSTVSQAAALAVPAGAQLWRRFDVDRVVVQFKAQPVFGAAAEDFPTLEAGPAALVFSREGTEGQVVLVMGDTPPVLLPFPIKLNIDGSSVGPVDVQLAYERTTGNVVVAGFGQELHYVTGTSTTPVEVVISAGAHAALALQNLTVRLVTPDGANGDAVDATKDVANANGSAPNATSLKAKTKVAQWATEKGGTTPPADTTDKKPSGQSGNSTLEIYTPASVRHGRVDAVRAAVVQAKKS